MNVFFIYRYTSAECRIIFPKWVSRLFISRELSETSRNSFHAQALETVVTIYRKLKPIKAVLLLRILSLINQTLRLPV